MQIHQTKKFLTAKETINKIKKQPTEWRKIFSNNTSDKELISKVYKELIQFNTKKDHKQSNSKMGRGSGQFSKEDIQRGQETYEKMLNATNH